jgi:hypothetical protein
MSEMRGCDLVVDYLIKEQTPYIFGYAGHGAVGLLDGVYHREGELKLEKYLAGAQGLNRQPLFCLSLTPRGTEHL